MYNFFPKKRLCDYYPIFPYLFLFPSISANYNHNLDKNALTGSYSIWNVNYPDYSDYCTTREVMAFQLRECAYKNSSLLARELSLNHYLDLFYLTNFHLTEGIPCAIGLLLSMDRLVEACVLLEILSRRFSRDVDIRQFWGKRVKELSQTHMFF